MKKSSIILKQWTGAGISIFISLFLVIALIGMVFLGTFVKESLIECSAHEYALIQWYQNNDPALIPLVKKAMEDDVITQYEFGCILKTKCKNSERILGKQLGDIKRELK